MFVVVELWVGGVVGCGVVVWCFGFGVLYFCCVCGRCWFVVVCRCVA